MGATLKSYDLWFTATHPGDTAHKPAVQQAKMTVPLCNMDGVAQHIRFPLIPHTTQKQKSIVFTATSDAGLPVQYYVLAGPAVVEGNTLRLTKIPSRSQFPVKVTIVAWQYGKAGDVQTAEPVEQMFMIEK